MEFVLQGKEEFVSFHHAVCSLPKLLFCFIEKACALASRPGPHSREATVDQSHRIQTIESRIDPAIERNVRGTLIPGSGCSVAAKDLADRAPFAAAEFPIVMAVV